ncbi:MAG: type 1 glutamine amidotransferase domain-containing protein [Burkholderiales bacterium]|nr:MAG: type 1 glutamine amidotransferase domain-containing protein [Burkholderiales bacterium]
MKPAIKPVLMIVTSHAQLGNTGKPTGIWAEELTTPFYALVDAGFEVTLASPLGGLPPFAEGSVKEPAEANEGSVKRFLQDAAAMVKFKATHTTASVKAEDFSAVFLPGGHGTMWDTATDPHTARLVADSFNSGKPTASVCHGPAGIVQALRPDGKSIVFGKKVNAFTNEEETAAGLMDVVPFHLETKLRELGGIFEHGPMWGAYAVRDGNIITGQNPASSALVAQHVVAALQGK